MAKSNNSEETGKSVTGKSERLKMRLISIPMALLALSCIYPIIFAINTALKTPREYIFDRLGFVDEISWQNFGDAWARANLSSYFFNSLTVTVGAVFLLLTVSSMAGFSLARLKFKGRRATFYFILMSLMIPVQVVLVPFYQMMNVMGMIDTRIGLILAYTAFFMPFSIYMMTAFYSKIPSELVDAARIDGANLFQTWWYVMVPMGKPALLTLGILNTLYCWNDILISLLIMQEERTLMVGVAALRGEYSVNMPLLAAGIVIAALPVTLIYIFFQRKIVGGIAVGAVKG